MKIKKIILVIAAGAAVSLGQANAGHDNKNHEHHSGKKSRSGIEYKGGVKHQGKIIRIQVNGLVCDFCAYSIRRVFMKTGAAEEVDVNLKHKIVSIYLKQGKEISDNKVKSLLEDSGYSTVSISRHKTEGIK